MSADPYIQAPYYSQSLNRYAYVWNNPLSLTDPSGFATRDPDGRPTDGGKRLCTGHEQCEETLWWLSRGSMQQGLPNSAERNRCGQDGSAFLCNSDLLLQYVNASPVVPVQTGPQTGVGSPVGGRSLGDTLTEAIVPGVAYYNLGYRAEAEGRYMAAFGWHTAGHAEVLGTLATVGVGAVLTRGTAAASRLAARGTSGLGGIITSTMNSAGGTVVTATGRVVGSDFAGAVNSGMLRGGPVNILSGAHGEISGVMRAERAFFEADRASFGHLPGVNVLDVTRMAPGEISRLLRGPGTTIGVFCDSGACLAPFR